MATAAELTARLILKHSDAPPVRKSFVDALLDDDYIKQRQDVSFGAATTIDLGSSALGGWFYCFNKDGTNFVTIYFDSIASIIVKPGEFQFFRIAASFVGAGFEWKADTANVNMDYFYVAP